MTKTITIPIPAIKLLTGLTLIFAAAKVFGFSQMSWFWVLFPVLLPVYIVVGVVLVGAAIYLLFSLLASDKAEDMYRWVKAKYENFSKNRKKVLT
uniref:Holin n=1 Tax=Klebsiella phage K14-2 TaxID=3156075 RepID=A0AB39C9H5_9VIRU